MSASKLSKYEQYKSLRTQFVQEVRPEYQKHVDKIASDILNDIEENAIEEGDRVDWLGIQVGDWEYFKDDIFDAVLLECSRQPFATDDPLDVLILSTHMTQAFYALSEYPRDEQSLSLLALIAFIEDVQATIRSMIDQINTQRYVPRHRRDLLFEAGWSFRSTRDEIFFSKDEVENLSLSEAWEAYQSGVAQIDCSRCNGTGEGLTDHGSCTVCRGRGYIEQHV